MSKVTISAKSVHSIDAMSGGGYTRMSLCVEMNYYQIIEAASELLGKLTDKQVADLLENEFPGLITGKDES